MKTLFWLGLVLSLLVGCVKRTDPVIGQFSRVSPPSVFLLHDMPAMVKGGTVLTFQFQSKAQSTLGVRSQIVEVSYDQRLGYEKLSDLDPSETTFQWTVPKIDQKGVTLRVRALDSLYYESNATSAPFEIRSTPPILTQDVSAADRITRTSTLNYGGACVSGYDIVIERKVGTDAFAPVGQVNCANARWAYQASATADAVYDYRFLENDEVLNESVVLAKWERDTVAPALSQNVSAATIINNLNQVMYGGNCENGLPVEILLNSVANSPTSCVGGKWSYTAQSSTEGVFAYLFRQTDAAGNVRSVPASWTRDVTAPALTQNVAAASSKSNAASLALGGACENGLPIALAATGPAGNLVLNPATATCTNGLWNYAFMPATEGQFTITASQKDVATNLTTVSVAWLRDASAPEITATSFILGNGKDPVTSNYVPTALEAKDTYTNITALCLKYGTDENAAAVVPGLSDECWLPVNGSEINLPLMKTFSLKNFLYRIGFTPGLYVVDAFVRDELGQISLPARAKVFYTPTSPPVLINVIASKSDAPTLPLSSGEGKIEQGQPVYIHWKVDSATGGLDSKPITIFYTTDDSNFEPAATGLSNGQNGGCSLNPAGRSTGCYVWNNPLPSTSYFRIRVAVTDKNGMITAALSNFVNANGLDSLAGNTDPGVDASATAAVFVNERESYLAPDPGSLVVARDGQVFFRDYRKGIFRVTAKDGVEKLILRYSPSQPNTYEGTIEEGVTTVRSPAKIALDYNNGLLIWDYDRIRRLDLKTNVIATLIGGGTNTADGVAPSAVQFTAINGFNGGQKLLTLVPLPNGDVLFTSDRYNATDGRLRIFHAAQNLVDSINVSGKGHGPNGSEKNIDQEELSTCTSDILGVATPCRMLNFAMEFDTTTSALTTLHVTVGHPVVGNLLTPLANLTPSGANAGKSLAPHPAQENGGNSFYRIIGRNGKIYSVNKGAGSISRFDKANNAWVKLVGAAGPGTCVDGTAALACAIQPTDAFVDGQGNLFFIDRGRVRTVDGTLKVATVYGQSYFFGDGGLALSARFNVVPNIDRIGDGRIVAIDTGESRLREFLPGGLIRTIAGNGTITQPALDKPASTEPFSVAGAGKLFSIFSVDRASGDVYSSRGSGYLAKLDRLTDRWVQVGARLTNAGYTVNVLAFENNQALVHSNAFDSSLNKLVHSFLRNLTPAGAVTPVAGMLGPSSPEICPDNTPLSECSFPGSYDNGLAKAIFDSVGNRWLLSRPTSRTIRTFSMNTGVAGTLTAVTRPVNSFAYLRNADGSESVYYCAQEGKIYHRNVATGVEAPLDWRVGSLACTGQSLIYNPNNRSLVFPYFQNGLYGIAEYRLP